MHACMLVSQQDCSEVIAVAHWMDRLVGGTAGWMEEIVDWIGLPMGNVHDTEVPSASLNVSPSATVQIEEQWDRCTTCVKARRIVCREA